jgi:hypothetical protein
MILGLAVLNRMHSEWVVATGPLLQRTALLLTVLLKQPLPRYIFLYFSHATQRPGLKTRPVITRKIGYSLEL